MAYELVYTSAPQGVNRGSSGFCVVACTNGLGPRLIAALEGFSAYKPLYPHYADNAWDNPVSRQHYIFEANGECQHILSRICFNGVDHTGRSNKLASHLVLSPDEAAAVPGGPAALLLREELFKQADWTIRTERYEKQLPVPRIAEHAAECSAWRSVTGDAGWGGYLAQCFLDDPRRNVYLEYSPELASVVPRLFDEAINLLPAEQRWRVTFNSYFVALPAGTNCAWRGVPAGSDALRMARRSPANIVIDLNAPGELAATGALIDFARTGIRPASAPETPAAAPDPGIARELPAGAGRNKLPRRPARAKTPIAASSPRSGVAVTKAVPARSGGASGKRKPVIVATVAALVLAVLATGVFFTVSTVRERRTYRRALEECRKWRTTLALVEKELGHPDGAKSRKELEKRLRSLGELQIAVEAVRQKAADLASLQVLFDDALDAGRLSDRRDTPDALREDCEECLEKLKSAVNETKRGIQTIKRTEERRRELGLKPDAQRPSAPAHEKKAAPAPPPPPKPVAAAAPAPRKEKKLAPESDPRTIWLAAERLYDNSSMGKRSVTIALGDISPKDIEIHLLASKREIFHPGGNIKCGESDSNGNNAELQVAYDESSGKLTITVVRFQLPDGSRIMVRVRGAGGTTDDIPLFFMAGFSKVVGGKPDTTFTNDKNNVLFRIGKVYLPRYIFLKDRKVEVGKYAVKYGGEYYMSKWDKDKHTLEVAFGDSELTACRKRLAEAEKQAAELRRNPDVSMGKIGLEALNEKQIKIFEAVRELEKELRADGNVPNGVTLMKEISGKIAGLRAAFSKKRNKVGKKSVYYDYYTRKLGQIKTWQAGYREWEKQATRFVDMMIEDIPMKFWDKEAENGDMTLARKLELCRSDIKKREEAISKALAPPTLIPCNRDGAEISGTKIELDTK